MAIKITKAAKPAPHVYAHAEIDALNSWRWNLSPKDAEFATSLIAYFQKHGSLSAKQWEWVPKLIEKAETNGVPDFTDAERNANVGSLKGLMDLFDKAKASGLKKPGLALKTVNGADLKVYVAGPSSKVAGSLQLTDGKGFGGVYYGSVTPEGEFKPYKGLTDQVKDDLTSILTELSTNPAVGAAKYGKLTGKCMFCKLPLDDEKSTAVGYGPVCAKNWGLPWGKKA